MLALGDVLDLLADEVLCVKQRLRASERKAASAL